MVRLCMLYSYTEKPCLTAFSLFLMYYCVVHNDHGQCTKKGQSTCTEKGSTAYIWKKDQ
jgi:hypothetical protein